MLYDLMILTLFDDFKGKMFYDYGDIYEGEWKDGKKDGSGKIEVIWFMIYWF